MGGLDRDIGRYIGRDSVEYRSSIGRYSVNTRPIYWSNAHAMALMVSVDVWTGILSVVYRSTIGDISVDCRSSLGRVSVDTRLQLSYIVV